MKYIALSAAFRGVIVFVIWHCPSSGDDMAHVWLVFVVMTFPTSPVEVRSIFPFTDASACERAATKAKLVNIATQKLVARAWKIETLEQRA